MLYGAHVYAPPAVDAAEKALSAHCSKRPTSAVLLAYLHARAAALPTLLPWHLDPQRRWLRWKRFRSEQASFSQFCGACHHRDPPPRPFP